MDGRELTFPESERMGINVWDPLQKPTISLNPDSRVIVRGDRPEISCFGNYPGANFSLYRDGEFIISQPAPKKNNKATFALPEILTGNYICKYIARIDGRQFTSPESERMGISVWGYWTWMHTVGLAVGIVTAKVITVFTVGLCVYKRDKHNSPRGKWNVPTGGSPQTSSNIYVTLRMVECSLLPVDVDITDAKGTLDAAAGADDGPVNSTLRA
ncbi:uncharacterized protein LOC121852568 [Callorhinchus milii]|uniref:uncharacterized protein LOC121852568 n=1 Tax=Callorhinchus milii TaxID=7868 RepID=UPI001C3FC1A7|nr:uncharacterized protein LOC121852568 [Callorhinchus milii]